MQGAAPRTLWRASIWFLFAIALTPACRQNSPTDPRCGTEPGFPNQLYLTCTPSGSSVACNVRAESNELYCGGFDARDVTSTVQWRATNQNVGRFSAPGRFDFTAPGATVIYAEGYRLRTAAAPAYSFGGGSIRELATFEVLVSQSNGGFVPLAHVEFIPEVGDQQTCRQGAGAPFTPCLFWVEVVDQNLRGVLSSATVIASAPGYTTVQRAVEPRWPVCDSCSPNGVAIRLAPSP